MRKRERKIKPSALRVLASTYAPPPHRVVRSIQIQNLGSIQRYISRSHLSNEGWPSYRSVSPVCTYLPLLHFEGRHLSEDLSARSRSLALLFLSKRKPRMGHTIRSNATTIPLSRERKRRRVHNRPARAKVPPLTPSDTRMPHTPNPSQITYRDVDRGPQHHIPFPL